MSADGRLVQNEQPGEYHVSDSHDLYPTLEQTSVVYTAPVGEWEPGWFLSLAEDCRAILTEAVFTSRWALVEGYHMLGARIVTDENFKWNARGNGDTLTGLSKSCGIGERDLYRAIQFYTKYPVLDAVPEGKNISWSKLVSDYLPEHSGAATTAEVMRDLSNIKGRFYRMLPKLPEASRGRATELFTELYAILVTAEGVE